MSIWFNRQGKEYYGETEKQWWKKYIDKMFENLRGVFETHKAEYEEHKTKTVLDHPDGCVTDEKIGIREITSRISGKTIRADLTGHIGNLIQENEELVATVDTHIADKSNPHNVTAEQVGLGNVDNVQQASKTEFDELNNLYLAHKDLTAGDSIGHVQLTDNPTYIGDDTTKHYTAASGMCANLIHQNIETHKEDTENPHGVTAEQVGLGNVDNTSDLNKPISTAAQTALNELKAMIESSGGTGGGSGITTYTNSDINTIVESGIYNLVYDDGDLTNHNLTYDMMQADYTDNIGSLEGEILTAKLIVNTAFVEGAVVDTIRPSETTCRQMLSTVNGLFYRTGFSYDYGEDNQGFVFDEWQKISSSASTLEGLTATIDELNYMSGVTSDVQTQLDSKANKQNSSGGFSGGNGATTMDGGAVGNGAKASDSGGAVGLDATATHGGAVGKNAKTGLGGAVGAKSYAADGGGAVGYVTETTNGGAVGRFAKSANGGAVGYSAKETDGGGAVGYKASATYGGAVGNEAKETDGGFAGGKGATASSGGAVGCNASVTTYGGAVGNNANAVNGGAVGSNASETNGGGAVGRYAKADDGGAVGRGAKTGSGFAGGNGALTRKANAESEDEDYVYIDAIQLGSGTNENEKTLQVYDYTLMNADGTIPTERVVNANIKKNPDDTTGDIIDTHLTVGTRSGDIGENSLTNGSGNVASGENSHAGGYCSTASGDSSNAVGFLLTAQGVGQTVIGKHNKVYAGATSSSDASGSIFIVGVGTDLITTANAFRITNAGQCMGTTSFSATGTDYAEYFEWMDGNPEAEDRRGYFVTLEGCKIRKANSEDEVLGIISAASSVIGNAYTDMWQGMYLTDVFGERLTEIVEVPETVNEETGEVIPAHSETRFVINPDYDPEKEYLGRNERKEWSAVGLFGQLVVRDDGTCEVGGYCRSGESGIATASESGFYVMERIDAETVRVYLK